MRRPCKQDPPTSFKPSFASATTRVKLKRPRTHVWWACGPHLGGASYKAPVARWPTLMGGTPPACMGLSHRPRARSSDSSARSRSTRRANGTACERACQGAYDVTRTCSWTRFVQHGTVAARPVRAGWGWDEGGAEYPNSRALGLLWEGQLAVATTHARTCGVARMRSARLLGRHPSPARV